MQTFTTAVLLLILDTIFLISAKPASMFEPESPPNEAAEVHVKKRSTSPTVPKHADSRNLIDSYEYDVQVQVSEAIKKLKLRSPEKSLFTPGFKLQRIDVDKDGRTVFIDDTPSAAGIRSIEDNIFVDAEANAAIRLKEINGDFQLDGIIDGARIRRENDRHFLSTRERRSPNQTERQSDVVDLKRPVAMRRGFSLDKPTDVVSEIVFVVDFTISSIFGNKKENILEYLSIMLNAVNGRYALSADPKVTFKFAGVYLITTKAAQPFIEKSRNGNKGHTIGKILDGFATWAFQNKAALGPYDQMPLLTGVKSDTTIVGIAYVQGACWHEEKGQSASRSTSVTMDNGKTWEGSYTLAHELAHSLGAPHDGQDKASECPWKDGYLMSYEGWGQPNKFRFSECSKREMKIFIESTGGACLWTNEVKTYEKTVTKQVGDAMDLNKLCQLQTGKPNAVALDDRSADDFCKVVFCRVAGDGMAYQVTQFKAPGQNTPCGVGGKCSNGVCENNKENPSERLDLNKLCKRKSNNPTATLVIASSGDEQCQKLACEVKMPGGKSGTYTYNDAVLPNGAFPCGEGGTCQNKKCAGNKENPNDRLDLVKTCVKRTGNPGAKVFSGSPPQESCKVLKCEIKVKAGIKYTSYPDFVFPEGSYPCGDGGKCVNKVCTGESPDRFDMNKQCKKKVGDPQATVEVRPNANEQCQKLYCQVKTATQLRTQWFGAKPIDGSFPCGANGICKAGACTK